MESDTPRTGAKAAADRAERERREALALRENLKRRKEQSRARAPEAPPKDPDPCP
jgi:hypothetical protein